jgi:small subunit ribosomal protein S20
VANTRSARKRIRANERKHVRNRAVRSAVRTKVGRARRSLLTAGAEETSTAQDLHEAIRALDRAAEKGIIHKNNARRRTSRLASMAARLAVTAGAEAEEKAAARSAAAGGAKGRAAKPAARKASASPAPAVKRASPVKSSAGAKASGSAKTTRSRGGASKG